MDLSTVKSLITQLAQEVGLTVTEPAPPGPTPTPSPTPGTLRVLHWNLHHGGIPIDATGKDLPLDVPRITTCIVACRPDLVSLNELEEQDGYGHLDQLEVHRAALQADQGVKWYAYFTSMSGGSTAAGGGVGILTKVPPIGPVYRKGLLNGRPIMAIPQNGFVVMTTHPESPSQTNREQQIRDGLAWQQTQGFTNGPAILCGDFNAVPTAAELAGVASVYQDAWVAAASKIGGPGGPGGITHGVHRIDYVWVKGFGVVSAEVVATTDPQGTQPSDHAPVLVVLSR